MLLSRAFCLILGTMLFVLIWTMQDGNHRATRMARSAPRRFVGPSTTPAAIRPTVPSSNVQAASDTSRVEKAPIAEPIARKSVDSLLWMFAEEPQLADVTQIAVK